MVKNASDFGARSQDAAARATGKAGVAMAVVDYGWNAPMPVAAH